MKTLLFALLLLPCIAVAQEYVTTTKSGEYKLRHNGDIQSPVYYSQKDAISAANKMSSECHVRTGGGLCTVAVQQPELVITTRLIATSSKAASSKVAVSSAAKSSAASVQASSSSASSVNNIPVAGLQKINVCRPLERIKGEPLSSIEMIAYKFRVFSPSGYVEIEQKYTGNECAVHQVNIPQGALRLEVAAVAVASPDSAYITVEF